MDFCFVYSTASSIKEAKKIAKAILANKLAACVNILENTLSLYEWEGALREERECSIIAKTRVECFEKLKETIIQVHSYSCPCIVMLPIREGHSDFLDWIREQTTTIKK